MARPPFSSAAIALLATGLVAVALASWPGSAQAAWDPLAGMQRGVAVTLDDKECRLALEVARKTELIVYVQLAKPADVDAARRAADAAGLYGTRIFVAQGGPSRIHLADNIADLLMGGSDDGGGVAKEEVLRVLRPGGKALVGRGEITKPVPAGAADWSHHYHGPDNNPQSADTLARAPFLTQFVAEPRYAPAPQACVASAGRVFMAFGHVAWHEREEPMLNTLLCVNGYNGALLWKMPLRPGIMVDRSTMVATPDILYLADDRSCKRIDPATGKVKGEIVAPADKAEGPFWKWMALDGGVLFGLVGKDEGLDPDAKWKFPSHGWPWDRISTGYNDPQKPWGLSTTLLAFDPKTGQVLWTHKEDEAMDARGITMKDSRIYICRFGKYLACLDARTGREVWRRTAEKDGGLFGEIGRFRPGQGYVEGWKTQPFLKCTDKAVYFVGPQVNWLSAVSAEDGRFLWKYGSRDVQAVLRDGAVYTIGAQGRTNESKKLDALSGSVLADLPAHRRACTRSTGGPDGIFFRASEGTVRVDLASGKPQWITPMRPSCHVGVIIANGHCYWLPWACDCNLQMFGAISLGPAGDFKFGQAATEKDRLQRFAEPESVAKFDASPADWPAYRADNRRSARTGAAVPGKVGLLWQTAPGREFEPTAPTAAGGTVFVGGADGIVRALDAATGKPRWTAYTGGAVRYPPSIAAGRALVGSGDGWAYAFEAATGRLLWRFRASPLERKIPVYGALLDTWPVASGVLADGGTAYLAAGINNFDGTHVYALDAATGAIKWQNNDCGHLDKFSMRGVAVQGEMLLDGGRLYMAGGDAVSPGIFDAATGKCLNDVPTAPGSSAVRGRELTLAGGKVTVSGQPLYSIPGYPVYDRSVRWEPMIVAAKNASLAIEQRSEKGAPWTLSARDAAGAELWLQTLPGEPVRWGIAVDSSGRIFIALRDGRVLCYGAGPRA